MILTAERVMEVVRLIVGGRLYRPVYVGRSALKNIFDDEDQFLTDDQIAEIITNSPQKHKEAGIAWGWESRFDTWFKFPQELGFVNCAMGKPIEFSATGHMLVNSYRESPPNEVMIQNILLNALVKFRTDNPFRKNANSNVPLVLLLQALQLLHDNDPESSGVFRQELSLFICWPNDDAHALRDFIVSLRADKGYAYSDEYMYDICLRLLRGEDQRSYYKMSKICDEAADEYIRKMRSTGLLSLRGGARFIDFNTFEMPKIQHILRNYAAQPMITEKSDYYAHMGRIDPYLISLAAPNTYASDIRKSKLYEFASNYEPNLIFNELLCVCHKRESSDFLIRLIPAPVRFEFLISIALVQQFEGLDVNPNYTADDEGLPSCAAGGGAPDIVCVDLEGCGLFEVTLMCGRSDQINNEIIPISRHLAEARSRRPDAFSVFVAPKVHPDARDAVWLYKEQRQLDILAYDIDEFISAVSKANRIGDLLNVANTQ
jgi:hypothetical protein